VTFNWDITAGNVLTVIGIIVSFFVAHTQNVRRLERIETKLQLVYDWFKDHVINGKREREN